MKPTKTRNQLIYRASTETRSRQLGSTLSKDLRKKYNKRSARVVKGDTVKIMRGEFKGVDGKISRVSSRKNSVTVEGIKKEKTKGEKFDVYIHTSNIMITSVNSEDGWRMNKMEGKNPKAKRKEKGTSEKPQQEKSQSITEDNEKKKAKAKETKTTRKEKEDES